MARDRALAKAVGARVRTFREARGLSVPELAAQVKVHRAHLWRVEDGQTMPPLDGLLSRLAHALDVDLAALVARPARRAPQHNPKTTK